MPGQQPVVTARLVTSPRHAKALLRSLEDNIRCYEARHGTIPDMPQPTLRPDGVAVRKAGDDAEDEPN